MRLLLALIALLVVIAPAYAHESRYPVHSARHVYLKTHGNVCDVGTMHVPIVYSDLPPPFLAVAVFNGSTPPFWGCRIEVDRRAWTHARLCSVIGHEMHHLSGYRAPPGREYIDHTGRTDPAHHRTSGHLMFPALVAIWPPCRRYDLPLPVGG